ncbi:MAG: tetratricopeptide repeat protein, partial [Spirochaetia bacterium]|nr:tetratricopeptide repeat protein [Spirochaetia bacterium]
MIWIIITAVLAAAAVAAGYFTYFSGNKTVYEKALAYAHEGEFTDARGLIRAKIDSNPDNAEAHFTMAKIYEIEHNLPSAMEHLNEVRRINTGFPGLDTAKLFNKIGELSYKMGDYTESFENYYESYKISNRNEESLTHLAFMAIGQEEFETAEKFFKSLIEISPSSSEYRLARAVGLSMLKKDEAYDEFDKALKLNPSDTTAKFLMALECSRQKNIKKAIDLCESISQKETEPYILFIVYRLLVLLYYRHERYDQALKNAELAVSIAIAEQWEKEEIDAKISLASMSLLTGDYNKTNESLLDIELNNPVDSTIVNLANFRMDLEEGNTTIEQVTSRGFDFALHLKDWERKRFPEDAIYKLSGLRMDDPIDLSVMSSTQPVKSFRKGKKEPGIDYEALIEEFNAMGDNAFLAACSSIIQTLGFSINKTLPYRDKDGADFIGTKKDDKKIRALFRIRKW